ncbi:hypothetical protein SKAU_G00330040 [Synaphobranchus kaupii]|uniref:Prolactin n=1 Tax=Synaphobranchus kaupii TaxID=118154 RepID=A0A9Q1EQC9_SYNKA|nr:hypothetical protein SKAU_G00330040 [Synaphobranchus kaupii]
MLRALILLHLCALASLVPYTKIKKNHTLHDTYSRSLMLARMIHQDVRNLLPSYEEQLGIKDSQVSNLFMKGLPSCASNYSDWHSLERERQRTRDLYPLSSTLPSLCTQDATRLQQDSEYLQLFDRHINVCCSSEHQLDTQSNKLTLELQLKIRDLQVQITQQLKLLQQPGVYMAGLSPAPLCNPESLWYGRMEGYIVLRDLEKCAQKVVRDYTLMRSQQQQ